MLPLKKKKKKEGERIFVRASKVKNLAVLSRSEAEKLIAKEKVRNKSGNS